MLKIKNYVKTKIKFTDFVQLRINLSVAEWLKCHPLGTFLLAVHKKETVSETIYQQKKAIVTKYSEILKHKLH